MQPALVSIRQLPIAPKIAAASFALHALLYAKGVIEHFLLGNHVYPMWIFHIFVCIFLLTEIARPKKSRFYALVGYCILMPTNILRIEYVADLGINEFIIQMAQTIILCVPLYLAGLFFIFGREFYLSPSPNPSINKDDAR